MSALLRAQNVARAAYFKVAHGNLKAASKARKLLDGGKALARVVREGLLAQMGKVYIGTDAAAPYAALQLIQLRQAELIRLIDDKRIHGGNVYAVFDDCRRQQHVVFSREKVLHRLFKHRFGELPMHHSHPRLGDNPAQVQQQIVHLPDSADDEICLPSAGHLL